ncbi:SDR family NAD(P)-dependent oxidoreductase [Curtobacterium flaccumfaciens pv. flaccumfaciens]|uniref:SDR family NAD(P)-dependent oxidoreductase n=1 Tax=Curtobacterium flaccumfaciens TaxID=2035 RepID=UPI001BDE1976|nr:SDR family NAD(P)-dependent oxidoreductase [Curtobacterium flaccumfaciens]MBT1669132.1 SDR family NAD(P)-dependent oxidoreductase [Curtobacterium flaccumfaciens pv. flaccumfaciens]
MRQDIAVVTGGARGIGRQVACDLRAAGCTIVIGDLVGAEARRTAAEIGDDVVGRALDVTDRRSVLALIDEVETAIGPITLWVNNAGIMPTGRFLDQDPSVMRDTIDVNYAGMVEATAAVLPLFVSRRSGTIVNLASATAVKPLAGLAVYSGAKAAVLAFSEALRRELIGSGVTVRVVLPNLVASPMGAGMTGATWFPSVPPSVVSRAVLRARVSRRFARTVPAHLGVVLRLLGLLPMPLRDRIDAALHADRLGMGADAGARAAYEREILGKLRGRRGD